MFALYRKFQQWVADLAQWVQEALSGQKRARPVPVRVKAYRPSDYRNS